MEWKYEAEKEKLCLSSGLEWKYSGSFDGCLLCRIAGCFYDGNVQCQTEEKRPSQGVNVLNYSEPLNTKSKLTDGCNKTSVWTESSEFWGAAPEPVSTPTKLKIIFAYLNKKSVQDSSGSHVAPVGRKLNTMLMMQPDESWCAMFTMAVTQCED